MFKQLLFIASILGTGAVFGIQKEGLEDQVIVAGVICNEADFELAQQIAFDAVFAYSLYEKAEQQKEAFAKLKQQLDDALRADQIDESLQRQIQGTLTKKLEEIPELNDQERSKLEQMLAQDPEFVSAKDYFSSLIDFVAYRKKHIKTMAKFMIAQRCFKDRTQEFLDRGYTQEQFEAVLNQLIRELKEMMKQGDSNQETSQEVEQ